MFELSVATDNDYVSSDGYDMSLLWYSIATVVADVIFRPSLLTSQPADVKAVRRYYDKGPHIKLDSLLQ
jgi:hypothetical protein